MSAGTIKLFLIGKFAIIHEQKQFFTIQKAFGHINHHELPNVLLLTLLLVIKH